MKASLCLLCLYVSSAVMGQAPTGADNKSSIPRDKIVLIFEKSNNKPGILKGTYQLDSVQLRKMRVMESFRQNTIECAILNDFLDEQQFVIDNFEHNDTLVIPATAPKMVSVNAYPGNLLYQFYPGDTVLFSYHITSSVLPAYAKNIFSFPHELLFCTIKNRAAKIADNNYTLMKRALDGVYFFASDSIKLEKHRLLLDSLHQNGVLGDLNYRLYTSALKYEYYAKNIDQRKPLPETIEQITQSSDERIELPSYRQFLKNYIAKVVLKGKTIKISNGISIDFKAAFDSIQSMFKGKTRDYLLLSAVKGIKTISPDPIYKSYTARLLQLKNSTDFENYFTRTYVTRTDQTLVKNLLLKNGTKQPIEWEELLKREQGKLLYVDIWASWCIPCRAAMPASTQLREAYKDQAISFIYVSIDENAKSWEMAARAEGLLSYPNSFLLKDPRRAAMIQKLGVQSIPRYLLYNKKGVLVNANAPGPETPAIKALIDESLKQEP